ncbi:hypothetical protein DEU56DRAFT_825034 [Suillus clintonianus]|uniref:uncharacterized protein n=1 Tax=Suillus clintonianus TaxID=1904413 RepID=UPI001B87C3D7|nr:uncharacterized protein DEU56DRAFT_825034 [Suillus clintonianus]KAG2125434.1 hypothetical protein DEU56DRAFT_825034 [Suillus clintonianus]
MTSPTFLVLARLLQSSSGLGAWCNRTSIYRAALPSTTEIPSSIHLAIMLHCTIMSGSWEGRYIRLEDGRRRWTHRSFISLQGHLNYQRRSAVLELVRILGYGKS